MDSLFEKLEEAKAIADKIPSTLPNGDDLSATINGLMEDLKGPSYLDPRTGRWDYAWAMEHRR